MARPIRIEYSDAYYHVTSRGDGRKAIYRGKDDYELFYDILSSSVNKYQIIIYAFTLMTNHYHLILRTPLGNLSSCMRHINGLYTQKYNWKHKRVGHVLQGRYKAVLIENESYLLELIRYIHLNPYRAKMTESINLYPYSSHQAVIKTTGRKKWEEWYNSDWILSHFGKREKQAIEEYQRFIEEGKEKLENPLNGAHFGYILGSKELVRWVQENFLDKKEDREYKGIKESKVKVNVEEIIERVSEVMQIERKDILSGKKGKNKGNIARNIALYLIQKNCCLTQKELGKRFGNVSNVAISTNIKRFMEGEREKESIIKILGKIRECLNVKT
jgi:REP element-mobilizing transposase RayT